MPKQALKFTTHLPKQKDLDKFLEMINNKYQLPMNMNDLAKEQIKDPYFKDTPPSHPPITMITESPFPLPVVMMLVNTLPRGN